MTKTPHRTTQLLAAATLALVALPACGAAAPEGPVTPVGNDTPQDTNWKAVTVADGLMRPWSIAWLPDGETSGGGETMLVTERSGFLRVVHNGQTREAPVEGLPDIHAAGQGGLMDVALHPDFINNRFVYLTYSAGNARANRTVLGRGVLNDDLTELTDFQVLFRVSQDKPRNQHFGSRLLWLDDGSLLMSIGDGGNPPTRLNGEFIRNLAQDLATHFGKTVRLTDDGQPHPTNPYATDDDPTTDPHVYTYGHRNIQGMALHPQTRQIWATEHGARGGDELNLITPGSNYGWPLATYSLEYRGPRISDTATLPGAVNPEVVWTPCIAPSGLTFYTGSAFPDWQGDLFAGGLVLQQMRRLHFEDGQVVGQSTLQFDDRIRDVRTGPDGNLYVLTDEIDGRVLRIEPK
ncbi:MAG: PQQ-dependent sugar dehydrogenase [Planctomycetota bacterium]